MKNDMYRSVLEEPIDKQVLEFISSIEDDLWIAKEDIIGTQVHNIMLYEQKILNEREIKEILRSLETLKEKLLKNQLKIDNNFEDIHPFIEKCIIDDIGMDIGGKIHTGRSRNDQVSLDIRLKIREELNLISNELFTFCDTLLDISKKTIYHYVPLYTHLQRAQLGVFSHYLNNYISQILRSLERIEEVYKRVNLNPLGACAIGGTSININRDRTTELLGFDGIIENSIDAVSSRDFIYETLTCLSLISLDYSRISEDLILWATKEFNFIELSDQFCSVSSVMPQKKNPDSIELARGKCSKIISNLINAALIIKAIPTGYLKDFQELKMLLKSSFDLTFSTTKILNGVFKNCHLNEKSMREAVDDSYILALDLAELLVKEYNIPFRQSHEIVAKLVKNSKDPKDLLSKEKIEVAIGKVIKDKILISKDFVNSLNNLKKCLDQRKSKGSPSEFEVTRVITSLREKRDQLFKFYLQRKEVITNATKNRENLIKTLIK